MRKWLVAALTAILVSPVAATVSRADSLPPSQAVLAGDFDGDGRVTLEDFFLLAAAIGQRAGDAGYQSQYDLDGDGKVGVADVFHFSDDFGKSGQPRARRPRRPLAEVLKKVSGPAFAKVRPTNHGGPDESGSSNVVLVLQPIVKRMARTPGGMEVPMVKVPAGDFIMGSNARELGLREDFPADESPIHLVYLSTFWIDQYEITNTQYREFVKATRHPEPLYWTDPSFSGDSQPVIGVDWGDATAYCTWRGMFLPTEAQWEKAARGVDGRKYPWGNEFPDEDENGIGGLRNLRANFNSRYYRTFDVGSFPKGISPYGAEDMAGNVWEWCADWYDRDYYRFSPRENPGGPYVGKTRVVRGGAAHGDYDDVRAPYRGDMKATEKNDFVEDYVEAFNTVRAADNPDDPEGVKFQYRYFIGFRCAVEGN